MLLSGHILVSWLLNRRKGNKLSIRAYSILWCVTYYVALMVVSVSMPFIFDTTSFAGKLSAYAIALPAAYWMINDAKLHRRFIPHVVQPGIVMLWWIVVPIYLLVTRKWWGVLYLVLHYAGITGVLTLGWYLSVRLIWPIVFPDNGL